MNKELHICLVGDVFVDVSLKTRDIDTKVRLGGIVHAARALWALNVPYSVGYFSPTYLDEQINNYLRHHGCTSVTKLGNVNGTPNVMLIKEVKEIGDQGYEYLLRDAFTIQYIQESIFELTEKSFSDYLLISGNYDLSKFINRFAGNIHVDVANNISTLDVFANWKTKINTIFISTSSDIFKKYFNSSFTEFVKQFEGVTDDLIVKENRGGSRSYSFNSKIIYGTSSQPRAITHSVGVGDAYDAAYVSRQSLGQEEKIVFASWIAAEYAVTSFPDDFKKGVSRVLKSPLADLVKMPGISLPWENRQAYTIYVAGPDFNFVNTHPIEVLYEALRYHNFNPRRPVKENGQMEKDADKARKQDLVTKDLQLLEQCALLIAVLLYNDPGTLLK